jgi:hypothetical protein
MHICWFNWTNGSYNQEISQNMLQLWPDQKSLIVEKWKQQRPLVSKDM